MTCNSRNKTFRIRSARINDAHCSSIINIFQIYLMANLKPYQVQV
ncbi:MULTISPECIES: hypothetical protein [unclassified Bartonella]